MMPLCPYGPPCILIFSGFCKCSFGCLGEDADVVQNVQKYSEFDRENIKTFHHHTADAA